MLALRFLKNISRSLSWRVSGLRSFAPVACIYYTTDVFSPSSLSPSCGDENTISGLAGLAMLLAWCSCVGRRSPRRSSFVPTPSSWDGVVIIGSSLAAACLPPASRLGLRCRGCDGVLASSSAGVMMLAVSLGGSDGGGCSLCLLALRWCRIALLPVYSTSGTGRCCFGVPAVWVVLIGFSSAGAGSALLAFLSMSAGRLPAMRGGRDWRAGRADGCGLFSCLTGWSSFLRHSCSLLLLSLLLRLVSLPCSFLFHSVPFARPPLAGSSLPSCLVCSPAPGAWDVRTGDRFAAAGGTAVCLLLIVSCRSLRLRSFAFVLPAARVFISCLVFS